MSTTTLPDADELRDLARKALGRCGVDVASLRGDAGSRTPVTGADLLPVPWSSTDDVDRAVTVAHEAFLTWRVTPAPVRGALVKRLGELLRENLDDLADLVSLEVGKIRSEARGEVQEMVDICDFAVGLSRQLYGQTMPSERPGHRLMETWHPLGVVGVISAFNFPVAVWSWNAAVALVCGDTVVWKPSELTPLTALACSALLDRAAADVGAPDGLGQLVLGDAAVAERLVDNTLVPLVSATGSVRMGRAVGPRVAARFGASLLELGGNNATVVTPSADLDLAVRGIVFAAAGHRGPALHLAAPADRARERGRPAARQGGRRVPPAAGGQPVRAGTLVGPLVNEKAYAPCRPHSTTSEPTAARSWWAATVSWPTQRPTPTTRRRRWPGCPAGRRRTPRDVRSVAARAHLQRPRRGHRAAERRAAGAVVLDLHLRPGRGRAVHGSRRRRLRHRQREHRDVGAEIGGAFGGQKETGGGRESGSDSWKAYMRRATNTINYSGELPLAQGVDFTV